MHKENRSDKYGLSQIKWAGILENLFVVILAFYPLRHITWGLDFWDTGYNYANFQYMGTRHMDSMWLFSTYLANVTGNLLMKLPNADTLMGMNLYTGLFVSVLALTGYFFCTRKLHMPKAIVFAGEMIAISLCWCPTALLYNYLTYVLFMGSCILLYMGLTKESKFCMIGAGIFLGTNVLVRFSNLPQMAMILAVWAYDIIVWLERRRGESAKVSHVLAQKHGESAGRADLLAGKYDGGEAGNIRAGKRDEPKRAFADLAGGLWHRLLWHTLWCLQGYVSALVLFLSYIGVKYGIGEYIAGIRRLFAMTENASDYKATAMIRGIVDAYVENLYWVLRIGVIVAGGIVIAAAAGWLESVCRRAEHVQSEKGIIRKCIHIGTRLLWAAVCVAMIVWLYYREFCSFYFYSYDPIRRPGILFLMLTMLIAVIRIFHRNSPREEKLISGMIILIILLTSLGSNNDVFPSLNNLFIAAPYTLWESWRFVRCVKDKQIKGGLKLYSFPVKGILTAFLALCLFQFGVFGAKFVFAEATGVQDVSAAVDNNAVLRNMKMSPEKARWVQELSAYVNENGLEGQQVILYGYIPALSYYLQMPSAFNPWSDLDSYSFAAMEKDMAELEERMAKIKTERPVVLIENTYALYVEGGACALAAAGVSEKTGLEITSDQKWQLIVDFIEKYGYEQVFRNEKFALYR